ncbi:O-methyltransferase [Paenibacillus filicis]|uniref:O-methyltransferase n=1 Tax=Paenibacillus filicis TaxID=669464 RepID=A0ABU9DCI6_9BACL
MNQATKWDQVDQYISDRLVPHDAALDEALSANREAELPEYDVAPNQGKFLHLLALIQGSKRILEIGTLGGYSTIWLARALPAGGQLVTLELDPHHARVAQSNLMWAQVDDKVEIRVGDALEQLARLQAEGVEPFDLIFIDADKPNNPAYLKWALAFSRTGTVIVGDNVVRDGEVLNRNSSDPRVQGVRKFFDLLAVEPRITATAIQTVGSKGYDGFVLGLVTG